MAQTSHFTNEDTEAQQRASPKFPPLKSEGLAQLLKTARGQFLARGYSLGTKSIPTSYYGWGRTHRGTDEEGRGPQM